MHRFEVHLWVAFDFNGSVRQPGRDDVGHHTVEPPVHTPDQTNNYFFKSNVILIQP